jgi:hypothetical protein
MITVAAALVYILLITSIFGLVAVLSIQNLSQSTDQSLIPLSLVNIIGLVIVGVIAAYLSIVINIGLKANAIISVMAVCLYIVDYKDINRLTTRYLAKIRLAHRGTVITFILICVLSLIECVDQPKSGDSGLYHVQTIKWIETYGVVPGLGNLHENFALNSMWYPVSALFAFSFLGIQSLHVVNAALFIFAASFFLAEIADVDRGSQNCTSMIRAAAILFTLFIYKQQIGSPATDMPAALLVWIVLLIFLEKAKDSETLGMSTVNIFIIMLAAYSVTVKLSVFPVSILCAYLLYVECRARRWAEVWLQVGCAVVIIVPWVIRNIILSGYLFFPFPYLSVSSLDWRMPYGYVLEYKKVLLGWSRLPGPHWKDAVDMSLVEWVPKWLGWIYFPYKLTILVSFAVTTVNCLAMAVSIKKGDPSVKRYNIAYFIGCVGLIYWFVNAPDPRYGWSFIFIVLCLPVMPLVQRMCERYRAIALVAVLFVLNVYLLGHCYFSSRYLRVHVHLRRNVDVLVSPLPYPTEKLWSARVGSIVVYGPSKTDQCWYAPLPCTPILNAHLELRGDGLRSGFKISDYIDTRVGR